MVLSGGVAVASEEICELAYDLKENGLSLNAKKTRQITTGVIALTQNYEFDSFDDSVKLGADTSCCESTKKQTFETNNGTSIGRIDS
jgi:hypothetical protein